MNLPRLLDPETGRSKGFGFIQYKKADDAKQALEKMNGFELAGRNVRLILTYYDKRMTNAKENS
jgi:RNA-binding protein 39